MKELVPVRAGAVVVMETKLPALVERAEPPGTRGLLGCTTLQLY